MRPPPGVCTAPMQLPATKEKPLSARQELYAQAIARGLSPTAAYREAGYGSASQNAWRPKNQPNVRARIAQLLSETAALNRLSIEEVSQRLLAIVERGETGDTAQMLQLARAALMDLAKLHGMFVDKHELSGPGGGPMQITEIRRIIVDPAAGTEWVLP